MTQEQLQFLRAIPIEDLASRLGLDVRHHKALCPFHNDRHPSLSFNVRKNTYRCFVCDAHGTSSATSSTKTSNKPASTSPTAP